MPDEPFPPTFRWGTTSSSTGCEGAAPRADWSAWEAEGHAPRSSDGNGWATNFADDIALLATLGINSIRITVEWARVEPYPDTIDGEAVDRYRRMLEAARGAGLAPWITLHDGSLPGWFSDDTRGFRDEHVPRLLLAPPCRPVRRMVRGRGGGMGRDRRSHRMGDSRPPLGTRPPGRRDPTVARDALLGAIDANHAAWKLLRGGDAPVMAVLGLTTVRAANTLEARNEATHWDSVLWDIFLRARREGMLDVPGGAALERPEMAGAFDIIGVAYRPPLLLGDDLQLGPYPATGRTDATGFAPNAEELGEVVRRLADSRRRCRSSSRPTASPPTTSGTRTFSRHRDQLRHAITDRVDVIGYMYDTGIDGYEWMYGFDAPRGLIDHDRKFKPSGLHLQSVLTQ